MKTIFLLKSSLFSTQGQSSRLAEAFVAALAAQSPARIVVGEPGRSRALDAARCEIERLASRLPVAA